MHYSIALFPCPSVMLHYQIIIETGAAYVIIKGCYSMSNIYLGHYLEFTDSISFPPYHTALKWLVLPQTERILTVESRQTSQKPV